MPEHYSVDNPAQANDCMHNNNIITLDLNILQEYLI